VNSSLSNGIRNCESSIERIVAFDWELREAGTHFSNAGRALSGEPAEHASPEVGMLGAVMSAPYRACLLTLAKTQVAVRGLLEGIAGLAERSPVSREDNRAAVPLMERLQAAKERALETMALKSASERAMRNLGNVL